VVKLRWDVVAKHASVLGPLFFERVLLSVVIFVVGQHLFSCVLFCRKCLGLSSSGVVGCVKKVKAQNAGRILQKRHGNCNPWDS